MTNRVGQTLGNYHLLNLLGRGGFAEVYLGEHLRLKTRAAIKVLYTQLEGDDSESFLQEARTIAHLVHPHIVRIFDFDVQDGVPFLVMDYASNGNLRQRHPKNTQLPLETIVTYVKQVADALQYAHDERLIHRDIKPENMLLDRRNEILLSDFGIALIAQSTHMQSTQEVVGTAYYMAPEQLQGKPRLSSDQYALGIIVYEWLSGSRPFHGSFSEIASQHMFVPPAPLHERIPTISPALEEVVMTALAKDPHRRFGSIRAFATALEQASDSTRASSVITPPYSSSMQVGPLTSPDQSHVASEPQSAINPVTPSGQLAPQPITSPSPNETFPVREKQAEVVSTNTSASQYEATPLSSPFQAGIAPTNTRPPGHVPANSYTRPAAVQHQSEAQLRPPNIQPSKRGISRRTVLLGLTGLGLSVAGAGLTWWLVSRPPLEGTLLLTYKRHADTVKGIAWSPDGNSIASGSFDGTVQVWNAADGSNSYTYTRHTNAVYAVAWSPDGNHIASGSAQAIVPSGTIKGESLFARETCQPRTYNPTLPGEQPYPLLRPSCHPECMSRSPEHAPPVILSFLALATSEASSLH